MLPAISIERFSVIKFSRSSNLDVNCRYQETDDYAASSFLVLKSLLSMQVFEISYHIASLHIVTAAANGSGVLFLSRCIF